MRHTEDFFRYARERHNVYLLRRNGEPAPWTDDPVIQRVGFTNIYRELDRVTIWFRQNIRDQLRQTAWVVPATIIFRWFNRITTGEVIAPLLVSGNWNRALAEKHIRDRIPNGPWVTGSYMVCSGRSNGDKLTGMLDYCDQMLDWWHTEGYRFFKKRPIMKRAHAELVKLKGLAGFTAYEVVTDLRWTAAVNTYDRMSWAHAGPGCTRGGSRVLYGEPDRLSQSSVADQDELVRLMMNLLDKSRDPAFWPQDHHDWPLWEMREVEHTLCEFDKYERVRREQGPAKRRFYQDRAGPLLPSGLGV